MRQVLYGKTGLFFGTFNPIHLGHLLLAEIVLDQFGLEKIAFIPAGIPPHRSQETQLASPKDRLFMVNLAIGDNPRFTVWEDEVHKSTPSYTIETLAHRFPQYFTQPQKEECPVSKLPVIQGSDALKHLGTWHQASHLMKHVCFLQAPRHQTPWIEEVEIDQKIYPLVTEKILMTPIGISATTIRQKVATCQSIRYWVPLAVQHFIENNGLYRSTM